MQKIIRIKFFIMSVIIVTSLNAQNTTIINYQTWGGVNGCNIFSSPINVPATLNNIPINISHQTNVGQPVYTFNPDNAVSLTCNTENNSSSYKGTEYTISYTFKKGYKYYIKINAACINSMGNGYPNASLRLCPHNGGAGGSTQCKGDDLIDPFTENLCISNMMINNTWSDYIYTYDSFSSQQSYFKIAAVPPINSGVQTILIRKITITETPNVNFTLTPASVNLPAGNILNQVFTVNNTANIPGVTSYEWNLGAVPNGWMYQGNAAPQVIVTAANTLSLSSVPCTNILKDVTAIAKTGNKNYPTNASTAKITAPVPPNLSITGSKYYICNGAIDYTLNGMPDGTPVQWESSDPAVATVAANGNLATVTKVSNGSIILTAKVQTDCGHFFATTKQIQTLSAPASIGIVSLSNIEFCGDGSSFKVLPNVNNYGVFTVSSYSGTLTWSLAPYSIGNKMSWYDKGNGTLSLSSKISNSSVALRCKSTNSCGSTYKDYWFTTGNCPVALAIDYNTLNNIEKAQIFPNPSNGQFNISLNTNNPATAIQQIIIKNKMGITIYQQAFKNNQKIQTINLSGKPADIYTIQIFDGRKWITERLSLNK